MKNLRLHIFFWLLMSLLLLAQILSAQGITVNQSIDRTTIPFEETVTVDITLTWQGTQFAYRFDKPLNPQLDRLKIKEYSSTVSSSGSGDTETTTKKFRLTLAPTSAGKAEIMPITIPYLKWPDSIPGEVVTEGMSVSIADPKPTAQKEEMRLVDWVKLIAVIIAPLALITAFYLRRKRQKNQIVKVTPKEKFLADLSVLKTDAGSDLKKFQTGLYKILSDYLSDRYYLTADRLMNEDISTLLAQTDLYESQRKQLGEWFERARADRFRPVDAQPGETIRLESEIRQFFEQLTK
jgi:hypothetical protein